jgi:hypothetical protein
MDTNLIMPEPTVFLDPKLGPVSILRPTSVDHVNAVAAVTALADDGLLISPETGKKTGIVDVLMTLAVAANAAQRSTA